MATSYQSQVNLLGYYHWTDFYDKRAPLYVEALKASVTIEKTVPKLLSGVQGKQEGIIRLKNKRGSIGPAYGFVDHTQDNPTLETAPGLMVAQSLRGSVARMALHDLDSSVDIVALNGIVKKTNSDVLTITSFDYSKFTSKFPIATAVSLYTNIDLSQGDKDDTCVITPLGLCTRVKLYRTDTTDTTNYDYGPVHPSVTLTNVYRNGRLVSTSEYTWVVNSTGHNVVRFTEPQIDGSGSQFTIQVDMVGTAFSENFATAIKFILEAVGFTCNAASFTAAAAALSTLSYKAGGVITKRTEAEKLVRELAVRGMLLDVDSDDELIITVDSVALHALNAVKLEKTQTRGNITSVLSYDEVDVEQQVRSYTLKGYLDPGFTGQSSVYELSASRTLEGTADDNFGLEKEAKAQFIFDSTTLDKECDYRFKILRTVNRNLRVQGLISTKTVDVQDTVSLSIFEMYIEDETWRVAGIKFHESGIQFTLVPYNAADYTFAAGTVIGPSSTSSPTDYFFTPPNIPINAQNITFSETLSSDGATIIIATFQVDAPSVNSANATHIDFIIHVAGSAAIHSFLRIAVTAAETSVRGAFHVDPGVSYDYKAFTINDSNNPNDQESARVQKLAVLTPNDTTIPATPSNLAILATEGVISLDWTDNTEADLSEYQVYRALNAEFSSEVKIAEVKASRFDDVGTTASPLSNGITYHYRISATDRTENPSPKTSGRSIAFKRAVSDLTPATPNALTAEGTEGTYIASDGRVLAFLTFNVPAMPTNAVRMNILYKYTAGDYKVADQVISGGGTVRIDDLAPGLDYVFAVIAFPIAGRPSAVSATFADATPGTATAPDPPADLTATAAIESIVLDWTDNDEPDFSEYQIFRANADSFGASALIAEARASQFIDGLAGTTQRWYWIKAVNTTEQISNASSSANATGTAAATGDATLVTPGTPNALADIGSSGVYQAIDGTTFAFENLTVPPMPANGAYMNILYKHSSGGYKVANQVTSGDGTVRIDDLTPGVSYTYACRAFPQAGPPGAIGATLVLPADGDSTPPAQVISSSMVLPTGGKTVLFTWLNITFVSDPTIKEYIIYGPTSNSVTEIGRSAGGSFTYKDNRVYGSTVFMRVKAIDYSGQVSTLFSTQRSVATTRTRTDDITDDEVTEEKRSALSSVSLSISARAAADATTGHPSVTNPLINNPEASRSRVIMPHVHHNGSVGQSLTLKSTNVINIVFSATNWQPTTWTVVGDILYW